ncbi:MAG: XRE family transcriptional regulator [Pedobacter sp.]|nr:MAG: XRE family transcriptional regulator [Pedobacter sp.]
MFSFNLGMENSDKVLTEKVEKELVKIGSKLKFLRKERGYSSPDKFAYIHGINRSQYGKYEAGRTNLTIATLLGILQHFEISLEEFFAKEIG